MKSKEKDIAKTICNGIFSNIGKLLAKSAEESFVSGEYEIYKSGKQAGLYEAKKVVKGILKEYLREESVKKVYGSDLKTEEPEVEKEKLYSELVIMDEDCNIVAPKSFVDYLNDNGYSTENSLEFYRKQKISFNVRVFFKKNHFAVISYNKERRFFSSDLNNTTLTGFKRLIKEAENCILTTNGENDVLFNN